MITGTRHSDYHKVKATSSTLHSDIIAKPERTQITAKQNKDLTLSPHKQRGQQSKELGWVGALIIFTSYESGKALFCKCLGVNIYIQIHQMFI